MHTQEGVWTLQREEEQEEEENERKRRQCAVFTSFSA
jgi:hypothetical protein